MKQTTIFSALHAAVEKMSPEKEGDFGDLPNEEPSDNVQIQQKKEREIKREEISSTSDTLPFKGRQVVIYIKESSPSMLSTIAHLEKNGRSFHLAIPNRKQHKRSDK